MTKLSHHLLHQWLAIILGAGVVFAALLPVPSYRPNITAPPSRLTLSEHTPTHTQHWLGSPIFRSDRAPIVLPQQSTATANGENPFHLLGIMIWNNAAHALIQDQLGETYTVHVGSTVGDWHVEHIDETTVQLKSAHASARIVMKGNGHD